MPVTTPQEIFDAMPDKFRADKAGNMNATILFDLSGDGGGQWVATIVGGQLSVMTGTVANPTVLFTATAKDYVAMINGQLNPMAAFMQGRIRVKGDVQLAMRMQTLFG